MIALAVLLQGGRYIDLDRPDLEHAVIVVDSGTGEMWEECRTGADSDRLREFLKDGDREVRLNAACVLALRGIADGRELLTVNEADPWLRKCRIARALLSIDRPAGEKILRAVMKEPCWRARRAAATLLGEKPPEPTMTDVHRKALGELASDDPAIRDAAVAALMDAPEADLIAARGSDFEVNARLDHVVRTIRTREGLPITLTDAGVIGADGHRRRSLTLTNYTPEPLAYIGYNVSPSLYGTEYFNEGSERWKGEGFQPYWYWLDGETLAPGASITFSIDDPQSGRYRICDCYRIGDGFYWVYSEPMTSGR